MIWSFVSVVILFTAYICRRYRCQVYSTQRFSRQCDYMEKTKLAPLKVPWSVKYKGYEPLGEINESMFWWFNLTSIDGKIRFLFEVSPYTFCRVPFNPFGRTGVIGKGLFPRSGPNNMIITIVWSKTLGFLKMLYLQKGELLYSGYLDHPMNTDNAWVEATVYYFEVEDDHGLKETCPEWLQIFLKELKKCESCTAHTKLPGM